jgi:hypothetical protein
MTTTKQWKVIKIFHILSIAIGKCNLHILKMCMLGRLGTVVRVYCIVGNFFENFKNTNAFI